MPSTSMWSYRAHYAVLLAALASAAWAQSATVSPSPLAFGNVSVNTTSAKSVTLTNGQSAIISLSAPTISGGSGFSVVAGGSCGTSLGPGRACTYHIGFTPTSVAAYSATLSINDTASNSPQQVSLTGAGVSPVTLTFANTYFGNQVITTTSGPHTGTLSNNQAVGVTGIAASASGEFAVVPGGTCGTTLAAHAKCTILVSFTPKGLGARTGSLSTTDNASNSPQTVTITGTGTITGIHSITVGPLTPHVVQGHGQQFTATGNATTGTLNLTDVVSWDSTNTNVSTIGANGMAQAVAPGVSAIGATLSTLSNSTVMTVTPGTLSNIPCSTGPCVLTYHNDLSRDGVYSNETVLKPSNVVKPTFGGLATINGLNGHIYAQPLYLSGMYGMSSNGNVLYVATQQDYVYAYDADSYTQLWGGSFIPAGETPLTTGATGDLTCTNITPNVGITSTPVIDTSTTFNPNPVMYFVTRSVDQSKGYHQRLHAVDTVTGIEVFGGPVEITTPAGSPEAFDPLYENQRSGLALSHDANGNPQLYIAWASHCDTQPFRGWMMKFNVLSGVLSSTPAAYFVTTQGLGSEAGIWMSGSAPAIDNPVNGNVYVATGNGSYDGITNWGQSVIKFDSNLNVVDWYTPNEWPCLNEISDDPYCTSDRDLGSGGVVLFNVPGGVPEVMSVGKQGEVYVLYQSNLGHLDPATYNPQYAPPYTCTEGDPYPQGSPSNIAQCFLGIQNPNLHGTGLFSTPAIWNSTMFGAGASGPLLSYTLDPAAIGTFNTTAVPATVPPTFPYPGASLAVSWNGSNPATGILWGLSTAGSNNLPPTADVLRAYNPSTMALLYQSSGGPGAIRFVMPIVANGKVFVAGQGSTGGTKGSVYVYGLCPCK